ATACIYSSAYFLIGVSWRGAMESASVIMMSGAMVCYGTHINYAGKVYGNVVNRVTFLSTLFSIVILVAAEQVQALCWIPHRFLDAIIAIYALVYIVFDWTWRLVRHRKYPNAGRVPGRVETWISISLFFLHMVIIQDRIVFPDSNYYLPTDLLVSILTL